MLRNRAKTSRITVLNIWKLYLYFKLYIYFVYFKLYIYFVYFKLYIYFVYFKLYVYFEWNPPVPLKNDARAISWKSFVPSCFIALYIYIALHSALLFSVLLRSPLVHKNSYFYFTDSDWKMRVLQGDQGHQGYRGARGGEGQEVSSMSELFFNISRMVFLVIWFVWWTFLKLTCLGISNPKMGAIRPCN